MDTKAGMLVVAGICILVLAIGFLRKNAEILLNFIVRAVLGTMGIYAVNLCLAKLGIAGAVGINPFTVLTVGSLGTEMCIRDRFCWNDHSRFREIIVMTGYISIVSNADIFIKS